MPVPDSIFLIKLQAQVFSCEFYEIFKDTFFYKALQVATSDCDRIQRALSIIFRHKFTIRFFFIFFFNIIYKKEAYYIN